MTLLDHAKNIVCNIIAVALAMTVATVEALLPSRPDWLERVNELALQLQSVAKGDAPKAKAKRAPPSPDKSGEPEDPATPDIDPDRLLLAYNQLWQFVHAVRSDGLALDDKFCERVERDWSVATLLSYMRNADRSLQDRAGNSLESASTYLAAAASSNDKPAQGV